MAKAKERQTGAAIHGHGRPNCAVVAVNTLAEDVNAGASLIGANRTFDASVESYMRELT
jgi:hypothetical protein